jgi:hypothetical protein
MTDADRTDAVNPDPVDTHPGDPNPGEPNPVESSGDGWDPLPEEKMLLHPGEFDEVQPPVRVPLSVPSVPTQSAVLAEPDPAADPAELAMAELKARIAAHAPATSLVATVVRREERKQRRQRAATAVLASVAAMMKRKRPRDPLPIEYDPGVHGRDPREEEAWFKELPAAERERLQASWAKKRQHAVTTIANHRRNGNRRLVAALLVFAVVAVSGTRVMWAATAGAGICCAIWWRHGVPDGIRDPLRALGCLLGVHTVAMLVYGVFNPAVFIDAVVLVGFATVVGFDGEFRRTGGFDTH